MRKIIYFLSSSVLLSSALMANDSYMLNCGALPNLQEAKELASIINKHIANPLLKTKPLKKGGLYYILSNQTESSFDTYSAQQLLDKREIKCTVEKFSYKNQLNERNSKNLDQTYYTPYIDKDNKIDKNNKLSFALKYKPQITQVKASLNGTQYDKTVIENFIGIETSYKNFFIDIYGGKRSDVDYDVKVVQDHKVDISYSITFELEAGYKYDFANNSNIAYYAEVAGGAIYSSKTVKVDSTVVDENSFYDVYATLGLSLKHRKGFMAGFQIGRYFSSKTNLYGLNIGYQF